VFRFLGRTTTRSEILDTKQHQAKICVRSVRLKYPIIECWLTLLASLPAGEGPALFSHSAIKDWQPRKKSVSNACERCRRRKIRCDGETPCATCKRFTLQCVRTQKPREVVASSVAHCDMMGQAFTNSSKGNTEKHLKVEYTNSKHN
jgi:hypothetical protein